MKKITFAYPGGKARLATKLCAQFPQSGSRFVDVFAGRGNLVFRAMQLLQYDRWWINDIQTADFFECLRTHLIDVPERSREEYTKQREGYISNRTVESILLEPYLTFSGGGYVTLGGCRGGALGQNSAGISQAGYAAMLPRARELLLSKDVKITKLDYKNVLAELGEGDFAYLDPPYKDCDVRAYKGTDVNHAEMIEILLGARFSWALSEYPHSLYTAAFGEPQWSQERKITYGGNRGSGAQLPTRRECLWSAASK